MSTLAVTHTNPFPGLRPFREDEEHLFFGRESQVDAMVNKLAATHFLAVVGTSGCGKSSLVNCGLRPSLHRGLMASAGTAWRMAQFRPGSDPLRALAQALAQRGVLFPHCEDKGGMSLTDIIHTTLRMSKLGLVDIVTQARLDTDMNLLLVVDQFEELFRYRDARADQPASGSTINEKATAFVNLLLEVKQRPNCPIYVVLTMRSDFLGDCAHFPGLAEAINEGQYLVPRMTRDERREAIRGPAAVGGATITPRLLTRLVNDVGDNPDQLSILQHALNRTWVTWEKGGGNGPLDFDHYEAIGTMAHALDQHADEAYAELGDDRQRQIGEKLFKALTDKANDLRGVRRPTTLGQLCALAEASQDDLEQVIDVFRKPSRSFLMPPAGEPLEQKTIIDISHESLMRVWQRLNQWADEEARSAQTYQRLSNSAELHAAGKASLWRDPELQLALDWRQHNQPNETWAARYHAEFTTAMDFLDASDHAARQARNRRRTLTVGSIALFAGIAVVMFVFWTVAQHNLNQVKVFVDTNKVEPAKNKAKKECSLLFASQRVIDKYIGEEAKKAQDQCKKVVEELSKLSLSLDEHVKTLENLEDKEDLEDKKEHEFKIETTRRLVQDLRLLQSLVGGVLEPDRLDNSLHLVVDSINSNDNRQKWESAIKAVAKNPKYGGLNSKPQAGLVPLGKDVDSSLSEFAHVLSGAVPARGKDGRLELSDKTGIVLVLIPGGSFQMGSRTNTEELPEHEVTVPPFFLSKYEVTQGQWVRLTGENNSRFKGKLRHPVEFVRFEQVPTKANPLAGLRLPSEAEWEYAARESTTTPYWWGKDSGWNNANCDGCGSEWDRKQTAPVGSFAANPFGLYDTAGNVWEWVEDCWHENYKLAPVDGRPWREESGGDCPRRVIRGGSWNNSPRDVRSATRTRLTSSTRTPSIGFRFARDIE